MRAMKNKSHAVYELLMTENVLEERSYCCYGIKLCYAGTEVCVEDLSLNKEAVEELIEKCNRLQLSPLHFRDVLEDFLES